MSGPKYSSWEIRQEQRERIRRERERNRVRQLGEISAIVNSIHARLSGLREQHGHHADYVAQRVEDWLDNVKDALDIDLRQAWRGIKGINHYLDQQAYRLEEKTKAVRQRQQFLNKIREEATTRLESIRDTLDTLEMELGSAGKKLLRNPRHWLGEAEQALENNVQQAAMKSLNGISHYLETHKSDFENIRKTRLQQEKSGRIITELQSISDDCMDIMNPAIEQRISLFSRAIETNPDNRNTLAQITAFQKQINELMESHQEKQAQLALMQQALSDTLGASAETGSDGAMIINGNIDGVPIRATVNTTNNDLHLDTPTDGSCRQAMTSLNQKLGQHGVDLGPLRILNTGETIGNKVRDNQDSPIRA